MKKLSLTALAFLLWCSAAIAQTSPGLIQGQVLTPAQWNQLFINKQDTLGFTPINSAGGTFTGRVVMAAPGASTAGVNLTPGITPGSPINGDLWTTTAGIFVQINGATVGPLIGASISNFGAITPIAVSFPSNVITYSCPTCGVITNPLSQFAATTSLQLAGVISDETGTGALVFGTSPTISGLTVTGAFIATGLVTNADLVNTSVTVNGQNCTLGSTCTVTATAASITVGTTTVASGVNNDLLFNNGGVLGQVATAASGVLVTSAGSVPSISSTLPSALTVPSPTFTGTVAGAGTVPNSVLVNSSTTINGTAISLGASGTVTAAAGTLTGTTLNSTVVTSSLTSVGTLTGGATGAGFTIALTTSTVTGTLPSARLPSPFTSGTASGNTSIFATTTGTLTAGNCVKIDASGNFIDAATTCGGGAGGSPGGSNTQVQYNNLGAFGGITGATSNGTALTLVAPVLGTPASATLTNATGLPISTGVSGLGTGIATFLATPTSANLATALTDETGTGAAVFGTSPTIATPTFTGLTSAASLTLSSTLTTNVIGSTQCLQANSSGVVSGTGAACTSSVAGVLVSVVAYASSQTVTIPATATKARIRMWGGSGGGGGSNGAGGGGGAGYLEKYLTTLTAGNTVVFTAGAAGAAGGVGSNGGAGGNSTLVSGTQTITTLTANGGGGGNAGAGGGAFTGGAGGTATNGDINVTGQRGDTGVSDTTDAFNANGSGGMTGGGRSVGGNATGTGLIGIIGGMVIEWYT